MFIVKWKDITIGILFGNMEDIKYKIMFENLSDATKDGLILKTILDCSNVGSLPNWISNRIPKNVSDKFTYLKQTQGRLENDSIWFEAI